MGWDATPEERKLHRQKMKERAKQLFCPNEECERFGEKNKGNIVFQWKYGKEASQNLFRCNSCRKTFSERRGTPLFYINTPEERLFQTIQCLIEGNGIRATGRIMKMGTDTVMKIVRLCGEHCKELNDYFRQNLHVNECQLDEFWTFIKKRQQT